MPGDGGDRCLRVRVRFRQRARISSVDDGLPIAGGERDFQVDRRRGALQLDVPLRRRGQRDVLHVRPALLRRCAPPLARLPVNVGGYQRRGLSHHVLVRHSPVEQPLCLYVRRPPGVRTQGRRCLIGNVSLNKVHLSCFFRLQRAETAQPPNAIPRINGFYYAINIMKRKPENRYLNPRNCPGIIRYLFIYLFI